MWKRGAAILSSCLAAMPLLGCAGGPTATSTQMPASPPAYTEYQAPLYAPPPQVYRANAAAPAAVLVVLPGADAWGADPALWASEGVDVVIPPPSAFYRLAAEQQQAMAQMMREAEQFADVPVWVMGPQPEIETALTARGVGEEQVSGIVETSAGSPVTTCSESFSYFDPGTGAKPQVKVEKSGNCPPGAGFTIGGPTITPFAPEAPMVPTAPAIRRNQPRIIETEATPANASPAAHRAAVESLAELIKVMPPS
jgi:hypothetical protein